MVLAAWWAALGSGCRSSFTPVAVGFAIAIVLAVARRARPRVSLVADYGAAESAVTSVDASAPRPAPPRTNRGSLILLGLAGAAFITVAATLYGSDDGTEPARWGAARRVHGRGVLRGPRQRPRHDRNRDDQRAFWVPPVRAAAANVVPLGRAVAGFGRHHRLRLGAYSGALLDRASCPVAGGGRPHGRGRAPTRSDELTLGIRVRQSRVPLPCADAADPGTVLQLMGRGHDLRGQNVRNGCGRGDLLPCTAWRCWTDGRRLGPSPYLRQRRGLIVPAHLAVALLALLGVGSVWAIRIVQSLKTARHLPVDRRRSLATLHHRDGDRRCRDRGVGDAQQAMAL